MKTTLVADANALGALEDDAGRSSQPFNQFAGKSTTYTDDFYSTKLDMASVSREQQQRAMQIENEIIGTKSSNRHVAEERNQVEQQAEDWQQNSHHGKDGNRATSSKDKGSLHQEENSKDDDEEAKYGATDRRNKTEAANQDGGVFKSLQQSSQSTATSASGAGAKKAGAGGKARKNKLVTAPPGKFKNFHAATSGTKNGALLSDMASGLLRDLAQNKKLALSDFFIHPIQQPPHHHHHSKYDNQAHHNQ